MSETFTGRRADGHTLNKNEGTQSDLCYSPRKKTKLVCFLPLMLVLAMDVLVLKKGMFQSFLKILLLPHIMTIPHIENEVF